MMRRRVVFPISRPIRRKRERLEKETTQDNTLSDNKQPKVRGKNPATEE